MPTEGMRVFQSGVVIWYDGIMTTGDYLVLDEKGQINENLIQLSQESKKNYDKTINDLFAKNKEFLV